MDKLLIDSTFLEGIHEALSIYSPNLCAPMDAVLRRKPMRYGIMAGHGESVDDQYDAEMPLKDAQEILAALVKIEQAAGYNAKFQNRQINLLVIVWRDYLEHLQTRLAPKTISPKPPEQLGQ